MIAYGLLCDKGDSNKFAKRRCRVIFIWFSQTAKQLFQNIHFLTIRHQVYDCCKDDKNIQLRFHLEILHNTDHYN